MYELWMLVYVAFFPLAYFGWLGMFGPVAKQAADRFWYYAGWVVVGVGVLMFADLALSVVEALIQTLFG